MKSHNIQIARLSLAAFLFTSTNLLAQIPLGAGSPVFYTQNFDSLATSGTDNVWQNNITLLGWYSSKSGTNNATYRAGFGSSNIGDLWSFGVGGVSNISDRALGSLGSGGASPVNFGVRFTNDTPSILTNFAIAYTGEQWRNGGNTTTQTLTFTYQVSSSPLTNASQPAGWINFSSLNFLTPTTSATAGPLDGNASTNKRAFNYVVLTGVSVGPSQEIFFRWTDVDDTSGDHGFGIDDFAITYELFDASPQPPFILSQPQSISVTAGDNAQFNTLASGIPAPTYQWQFNNANIPGATNTTLVLNSVTTNAAGNYRVIASNSLGSATSVVATLTVTIPPTPVAGFKLMNYNTHGNFVGDWTTNSAQVQAIGRQVQYLDPDIITFQEIPMTNAGWAQMGNFVAAYRPGFYLATNSGTDGFIRSAILSRFPITRSVSRLDGADLDPFGYTNGNFTRDMFEAEIVVPGFPQPLHVFTTHLKSGQGTDDSNRRAAEALAISNYFSQAFLSTNSLRPYLLTGDMNEDIARPPSSNPQSIEKLISAPTGLKLTTPTNLHTGSDMTFSIQAANPTKRYDYILPNALLLANIASSEVFRSDVLPSPPPPLLATDSETASDHMPVVMTFNNPYDKPFKLLSVARSNLTVMLRWESVLGQPYRVQSSTNLVTWTTLTTNLVASGTNYTFSTNLNDAMRFFRVYRVP